MFDSEQLIITSNKLELATTVSQSHTLTQGSVWREEGRMLTMENTHDMQQCECYQGKGSIQLHPLLILKLISGIY